MESNMKEYSIDEQIKQLETQIAVIKMHINSSYSAYSSSQINELMNERHGLKLQLRELHILKVRQNKIHRIIDKMEIKRN